MVEGQPDQMLNSDELGKKGQARFEELCVDAGMFANEAHRDRTGWDFYVEFPFPDGPNPPRLDSRPAPIESKVQVKTVYENAVSVKLRLSSAERLAKYPGASFVAVLVVDRNTKQFKAMYMLHIRGDLLSAILKKLRECEHKNSLRINLQYIRLNYRQSGDIIDFSGDAIKSYIAQRVGSEQARYYEDKQLEQKNLGVSGVRYLLKMTLKVPNDAEVTDIMLGLKSTKVTNFEVQENRWDIPLIERSNPGETEVSIKPHPLKAQLTLRTTEGLTVSEKVEIIIPANAWFDGEITKLRVIGEAFEILLDQSLQSMTFQYDLDNINLSLRSWIRLTKAQEIFLQGGELDIRLHGGIAHSIEFNPNQAIITRKQIEYLRDLVYGLQAISVRAGDADFKATAADLKAAAFQIRFLLDLLNGCSNVKIDPISVRSPKNFASDLSLIDCIFLGRFTLGDSQIAWSAVGTVAVHYRAADVIDFVPGDLNLRRIDFIEGGDVAFQDFRRLVQNETEITTVMNVGNITSRADEHSLAGG